MADSFYNTEEILALLQLEKVDEDRYVGQSHFMGSPNVFGGQALGQALYAACATVPDRLVHSCHSMFILPGNHRLPIDYEVERVRDGGTFSTRRVVGFQEGRRIFVMAASFQTPEEGLSHQKEMPAHEDPESLKSVITDGFGKVPPEKRRIMPVPVDFRASHAGGIFGGPVGTTTKQMWMRAPIALPDDRLLHESLFAYVSDYGLLSTALQPHGEFTVGQPNLQIASLDHTIWFHRPFRMDEWLLVAMETPNASNGRGLTLAYVYNQQGALVATLAQEGLIRLRQPREQAAG